MAKVTIRVPELKWRRETFDVPESKTAVVLNALRAQQDRINEKLSARNQEVATQLDKALNPDHSRGFDWKWLLLGLGGLVGVGIGVVATQRSVRNQAAQKATGLVNTATQQVSRTATKVTSDLSGKAGMLRSKVRSTEHDMEPATITARVETELGEDERLRSLPRINVNTDPGGVVYLRGALPTEEDRQQAERIARGVDGVNEVVNEINVVTDPSAFDYDDTQEDQQLRQQVESAVQGAGVDANVEVEARRNGIVYLRGTVRDDGDREQLEQAARRVSGVHQLINDLAVPSSGPDVQGGMDSVQ